MSRVRSYIDGELDNYDFKSRRREIAIRKEASAEPGQVHPLQLDGFTTDYVKLTQHLIQKWRSKDVSLIIIDPIYTFLGDLEENRNEHIAKLGLALKRLAKETGAAVMFVHHFAKGSQFGKRSIEKASGAGAFGRFVSTSIAIDRHREDDCFIFEFDVRSFKTPRPFVARRTGPIWTVEEGLDVRDKAIGSNSCSYRDLLDALGDDEISPKELLDRMASTGLSKATIDRRRKKALDEGWITQSGKTKNLLIKRSDAVDRNPLNGVYSLRKATYRIIQKNDSHHPDENGDENDVSA